MGCNYGTQRASLFEDFLRKRLGVDSTGAASVVIFINIYDSFQKELVLSSQDFVISNEMSTGLPDTIIETVQGENLPK